MTDDFVLEDDGQLRTLRVGDRSCATPYSRRYIEALIARKGPQRTVTYLAEHPDTRTAFLRPLLSYLDRCGSAGLEWLEVGCGAGLVTEALAAHPSVGGIQAYDVDAGLVEAARILVDDLGLTKVRAVDSLTSAQTESLPYPSRSFDLVVINAVIEHLPWQGRHRFVDEYWRVVKPGGLVVVLDTPNRAWPLERHSIGLPWVHRMTPERAFLYSRLFGKLRGATFCDFARPGTGWRNASFSELLPSVGMLQVADVSEEVGYRPDDYRPASARPWWSPLCWYWLGLGWLCRCTGTPFRLFAPTLNVALRLEHDLEARAESTS